MDVLIFYNICIPEDCNVTYHFYGLNLRLVFWNRNLDCTIAVVKGYRIDEVFVA